MGGEEARGGWLFRYLDDFLCLGAPDSDECLRALCTLIGVCEKLNIPLAEQKVGPAVCLNFVGIEVDMVAMQLRLPGDKLARLKAMISEWVSKKVASKRELQLQAGLLQHACKVVRPGRVFLRRIFDAMARPQQPHHPTHLNKAVRSNLAW